MDWNLALIVFLLVGSLAGAVVLGRRAHRPKEAAAIGAFRAAVTDMEREMGQALLPVLEKLESALRRFSRK